MKEKFFAYYRVSTDAQGRSGLGLEAQQKAVRDHVAAAGGELAREFVEVESGRKNDRPVLRDALAMARKEKIVILFAKLDRLARSARFLLEIVESGAQVRFLDLPQVDGPAGKFLLSMMASVAELEAGLTAQRTKAALAAAKSRGTVLGRNGTVLAARHKAEAQEEANRLRPLLDELVASGIRSAKAQAEELNRRGIPTARGGRWHSTQLSRIRGRLAA